MTHNYKQICLYWEFLRGDQDGRVGHRTLLLPWTYQKYIYMWNNSHWKLTGAWQKESWTTKAVRKSHMELGRKGREAICLGPVPLGGDSEEEGDYTGGPPWGVSSSSHILGTPAPGPNTRKTNQLGWLERRWEAWAPLLRSAHTLVYSQNRAEREDWNATGRWSVSCSCPAVCPSLSRATALALFVSQHNATLGWGVSAKGRAQLWGTQAAQTQSGICAGQGQLLLALIQAAHQKQTATACTQTHAEHPHQPPLLQHYLFPSGWGCWCWEKGEHILKGNGVSSDRILWASAPATWGPSMPLIGWWQLLSRGKALTWLWP